MPDLNLDFTKEEIKELISMVDGALEVVILFGHNSPHQAQKEWAKQWVEKAYKYGAQVY